jgi:hypothetical protein
MSLRRIVLAFVASSFVLAACAGPTASVGTGAPVVAQAQTRAGADPREVGASLFWHPFFITLHNGHMKAARLVYSPASLEFEVTTTCDSSIVTLTPNGNGQSRGHETNKYLVAAHQRTSYVCDFYATAPHAMIRSTLQVTVKVRR